MTIANNHGGARPNSGRKKGMRRTKPISFRVSDEELALLKEAAEKKETKINAFCREAALKEAKGDSDGTDKNT